MGNPLSPFIANVFLARFESDFSQHALFPKTWIRYVDDVFAIVKRLKIRQVLTFINSTKYNSLQFTLEYENDGKLPFLDLLVTRKENKISLGIYYNPTATKRYITNDSYHPIQHKKAAFNSMVHRLIDIPLSPESYEEEQQHIYEVALLNGYESTMIDQLINKYRKNKYKEQCSTLTSIVEERDKYRIVLPYNIHCLTINNCLKKNGYDVAFESNVNLQKGLESQDPIPDDEKSGVYEVTCPSCNESYIGQTRRRFKMART